MYNFKYKSTDVAIMLTHFYTLWCQVHNKDRLTCIDSWCSVALLWGRDRIEVWGHQLGWAAEHLPRLFRRLWRQEAEVNLCRLSLCVSPLKLISYCLLFTGSIDISFYVRQYCTHIQIRPTSYTFCLTPWVLKKVINSITNGLILLITDKYEKTLDILDIQYWW